jgi:large subunit ribosomal protein L18
MHKKQHNPKQKKRDARQARVVRSIAGSKRPRLTVFRSTKHIYAQLVDPATGQTIGSVSTRSRQVMGDATSTGNVEAAKRVGRAVAQLAREKQIDRVVFNRNGFLYHGRVRALAEAAREAGLQL